MKLDSLFAEKRCVFALEVFPPKRTSPLDTVFRMLDSMAGIPADYISVTYSAGGTGVKENTAAIARRLKDAGVEPLAHLTCLNAGREDISAELARLREAGVENILALRGDVQPGAPAKRDFAHASDLMTEIRAAGGFYVAGACYPEGHPESRSLAQDVERLKAKLDAGAGHLVSQLFFDNGKFFRFLNLARKKGLHCPVEAGVMPVVRPEQLERTIALSSASIPAEFSKLVSRFGHDPEAFFEAGVDYAVRQMRDLIEGGADGVHLYAMNRPKVAEQVYRGIEDLL